MAFDFAKTFEGLSFCTCGDCSSIFSPSAYLVDILELIGTNRDLLFGPSARTSGGPLVARRPDVGNIELTCDNTNTPMPYIDLAIEVLELAVADPTGAAHEPLTTGLSWPQTRGAADDIASNPENVNIAAYLALARATYGWSLPFNLWSVTARTFLGQLGVGRGDLMDTLRAKEAPRVSVPSPTDIAIAAERLGLTPSEQAVIVPDPAHPFVLAQAWRALDWTPSATETWSSLQNSVPVLLDWSGLTFDDLLSLLATTFVNPAPSVKVQFGVTAAGELTCDMATATFVPALGDVALGRMHRFERLRRKLGWTARELDKVISAFGGTELDDTLLIRLEQIKRLRDKLDLSVTTVLAFWFPIDQTPEDADTPSLYDQLFVNQAVVGQVVPPSLPIDPTLSVDDPANIGIRAGLAIAASDLALLLPGLAGGPPSLATLDKISDLYRKTTLARALGLSIGDFLALLDLSQLNPFDKTHVESTWALVLQAQAVAASGFSMAEIRYLLRDEFQDGDGVSASTTTLTVLTSEIAAGLAKLAADTAKVTDPGGTLARAKLSTTIADPTNVDAAMASLADATTVTTTANLQFLAGLTGLDDALAKLGDPSMLTDPSTAITDLDARYGYVVGLYLRSAGGQALVLQKVGAWLKLDTSVTKALLAQTFAGTPGDTTAARLLKLSNQPNAQVDLDAANLALRRLWKAALILQRLHLITERQDIPDGPLRLLQVGALDINAFPAAATPATAPFSSASASLFATGLRLVDFASLVRRFPMGDRSFFDIFALAGVDTWIDAVAARTSWGKDDLTFLVGTTGSLGFSFPADYADERILVRLAACFRVLTRLGVSAAQADTWKNPLFDDPPPGAAAPPSSQPTPPQVAQAIRQAAKAKYDATTWLSVVRPLQDRLRVLQRDALVTWLTSQGGFADSNDLFDWFLLDSEVTPIVMTSRIKQAIGSVQLFVQRAIMQLEKGFLAPTETPPDPKSFARHWTQWMYSYRIWEANRRVFAYPESFIHPDLRPDPTPFFTDLQSALLQRDPTSEVVEDAYQSYLAKLDEVARLEVMAIAHETDNPSGKDIVHVFARTPNDPHVYFYRTLVSNEWRPWERVNLDIQGDHLLPVLWDGRLFLFWPIFNVKPDKFVATPGPQHLEVQIAWSEYKKPKWLAKRMSPNTPDAVLSFSLEDSDVPGPRPEFFLIAVPSTPPGQLTIDFYRPYGGAASIGGSQHLESRGFVFSGCGGSPAVQGGLAPVVFDGTSPPNSDQAIEETTALSVPGPTGISEPTLRSAPSTYRLTVPMQQATYPAGEPFLYEDANRRFYVQSVGTVDLRLRNPVAIDPKWPIRDFPRLGDNQANKFSDDFAVAKSGRFIAGAIQ